jgi:hypothetical protein
MYILRNFLLTNIQSHDSVNTQAQLTEGKGKILTSCGVLKEYKIQAKNVEYKSEEEPDF